MNITTPVVLNEIISIIVVAIITSWLEMGNKQKLFFPASDIIGSTLFLDSSFSVSGSIFTEA